MWLCSPVNDAVPARNGKNGDVANGKVNDQKETEGKEVDVAWLAVGIGGGRRMGNLCMHQFRKTGEGQDQKGCGLNNLGHNMVSDFESNSHASPTRVWSLRFIDICALNQVIELIMSLD
ncbi:hypothetical protein PSHT_07744 [Puccinia striiformis]|uniref:Uncharacterized protein n=1 Tax=Puccinia striiformis TaxID=27350 RepID=A0A2S4VVN0_9BASI|nr:hypothetical protein PSHT_07744 [Puccinia striiformis]